MWSSYTEYSTGVWQLGKQIKKNGLQLDDVVFLELSLPFHGFLFFRTQGYVHCTLYSTMYKMVNGNKSS